MVSTPPAVISRYLRSPLLFLAAGVLLVALILAVLVYFNLDEDLYALIRWVETQGPWAAVIFILLMALAVVLVLPGIFFTTGAGAVFGVVEGSLYVVIGTTLGAALAFLAARFLFGKRARHFVLRHSKIHAVNTEMTRHAFKVVLLTRLIPFFPGKLSNYFFGLTSFPFPDFVLGSLIGFIPFSIHNVYLGAIAADLATLGEHAGERTVFDWAFYLLGFAATVTAVIYCSRLARRTWRGLTPEEVDNALD